MAQAFCPQDRKTEVRFLPASHYMNPQDYLSHLLYESGLYGLLDVEHATIREKGVEAFVVGKLLSKKHRKWKIDSRCETLVHDEVSAAIHKNRPINVFFAQGSYKLWSVASAPRANWSEFFNLAYVISYLAPIAAAYKPGVRLTYYLLTILPQTHNNLSEYEVTSYLESFQELIDRFQEYLPENFKIKIERDLDGYSRSAYNKALGKAFHIAGTNFYKWPKVKQDDYFRRARLNIKWNGVEEWTRLSPEQKEEKVVSAVLYEYAATQVILEKDKENRGAVLSTLPHEGSIGIGSTYTSAAKHWVGEGVLEESAKGYYPRILTPSQYEYAKGLVHHVNVIKLLPGEQFSTIEIYPHHFDFSQK